MLTEKLRRVLTECAAAILAADPTEKLARDLKTFSGLELLAALPASLAHMVVRSSSTAAASLDDAIDTAVFRAFKAHFGEKPAEEMTAPYKRSRFVGFNPTVKRAVAYFDTKDGPLKISKGLLTKVLDTGDGLYTVQYRVQEAGTYFLAVTLDGHHVEGSPFTTVVKPSHPAA